MVIIIDDYGVSIEKHNYSFKLSKEDDLRVISPNKVTALHILKPCTISTPAILLAAEFNIPVLFFDAKASVIARLWSPGFGSLPIVRYHQLLFSRSPEGLKWVAKWLALKTEGQVSVLKHCHNRINRALPKLTEAINTMSQGSKPLMSNAATAETLRIQEAMLSKVYWQALAEAMEKHIPFGKRSRRPAMDQFNTLLNYGYGILYSIVETAALTAGLDPQVGILHAENYNRQALVFDAIEPFRPWVDRLICDLAFTDKIEAIHFEEQAGGVWLNKEGKKMIIPAFYAMMHQATLFNDKRIKRKDQIQYLLTSLTQYLMKEFKAPDPYA